MNESTGSTDDAPEQGNKPDSGQHSSRGRNPWHYTPALPIKASPYFRWPPDVSAIARWMISGWFPLSERLVILLLAILSSIAFHPALERCVEYSFDWIAQIYIRNFVLMCLVAGGLHLYFHVWRLQADEYRFDARSLVKSGRLFTFNSQVRDNMFWTLVSGVSVWTAYEVLMMWVLANGYAPALPLPGDLPWLV
jgi:lathosterol oxidase